MWFPIVSLVFLKTIILADGLLDWSYHNADLNQLDDSSSQRGNDLEFPPRSYNFNQFDRREQDPLYNQNYQNRVDSNVPNQNINKIDSPNASGNEIDDDKMKFPLTILKIFKPRVPESNPLSEPENRKPKKTLFIFLNKVNNNNDELNQNNLLDQPYVDNKEKGFETQKVGENNPYLNDYFLNFKRVGNYLKSTDEINQNSNIAPKTLSNGYYDDNTMLEAKIYESLLREKDLLKQLDILESYSIFFSKDRSDISSIDSEKDEEYSKEFVRRLGEIKLNILQFLNWKTENRIKTIFSRAISGNRDRSIVPAEDFYVQVKYVLQMIKVVDYLIDIERSKTKNENGKNIPNDGKKTDNDEKTNRIADVSDDNTDEKVKKEEPKAESSNPDFIADYKVYPFWKSRRWALLQYGAFYDANNYSLPAQAYFNGQSTLMLMRMRLFSTLLDKLHQPKLPEVSAIYLKNKNMITTETKTMLTPVKAGLDKRGFSMLTRLRLFSTLFEGKHKYKPLPRLVIPENSMVYLKNNNMISAETRAMLRPIGAPLRWG